MKRRLLSSKTRRAEPTSEFDYLPTEILLEIFKGLSSQELRKCAGVCKRWRTLVGSLLNVDCVFVCDVTKSVRTYWEALVYELSVQFIVNDTVRYGFVGYTDHYPDNRVVTSFPLTWKTDQLSTELYEIQLGEGRDYPEAVLDGLYTALNLNWRPNSTKVCVLICDSPPHGRRFMTEEFKYNDEFADGCPCGLSEEYVFKTFAEMGVTCYMLHTHPNLEKVAEKFREYCPGLESSLVEYQNFSDPISEILGRFRVH